MSEIFDFCHLRPRDIRRRDHRHTRRNAGPGHIGGTGKALATGTLGSTLDAATLAGTAKALARGTLATTLDAATVAATGAALAQAELGTTLADLSAIATGKVLTKATLDATLFALGLDATAHVTIAGALAVTLAPVTLVAHAHSGETRPPLSIPQTGTMPPRSIALIATREAAQLTGAIASMVAQAATRSVRTAQIGNAAAESHRWLSSG